jgi:hypothetical protein
MDDKERDITIIFLDVMELVKAKRDLSRREARISQQCGEYGVDWRIASLLGNEYERNLEDPAYKMKTVSEIQEQIRLSDDEDNK